MNRSKILNKFFVINSMYSVAQTLSYYTSYGDSGGAGQVGYLW
jgi:hypothetical protein